MGERPQQAIYLSLFCPQSTPRIWEKKEAYVYIFYYLFMMNWKIGKPNKQEELCYSIEARPYATQEVALKWFSIEGNITSNPKQNAVRNMRNYIKRHRDLQEALAREGYRSYMRSLSPVLVQIIVTHRSKMKVIISPIGLEHS
jgi:hypothetical protein